MATYNAQAATITGTVLTVRNAASGDKITPDENLALVILNGSGVPVTATPAVPGNTDYGVALPDPVATIPASGAAFVRLKKEWADPADGLIALAWSATTSVTYYVVRV
ncbi:hypothetical protein ACFYUV_20550 [Nonomuraea sp. NPDC003560]|uniref:hypothetical protein n=1 Tax=Nonomuraea sp. NPDC003560 TaxID=3364341 RepID=UPI003689FC1F